MDAGVASRGRPDKGCSGGSKNKDTKQEAHESSFNATKESESSTSSPKRVKKAPREQRQQAGQPSGEGASPSSASCAIMTTTTTPPGGSGRGGPRDPPAAATRRGSSSRGTPNHHDQASSVDDDMSSASSFARDEAVVVARRRSPSEGAKVGKGPSSCAIVDLDDSVADDSDEVDDSDDSSRSEDSASDESDAPSTTDSAPPLQITALGRVSVLEAKDGNKNLGETPKNIHHEESSSSLRPKAWMSTEEYLPSSCSSSDEAEQDDDDAGDSLDDEDSFACSSCSSSTHSSSSSDSSSFLDQEGLEYVEYFTGDEDRPSAVFLHMPPRVPTAPRPGPTPKPTPATTPASRTDPAPIAAQPATAPKEIKIRPADLVTQMTRPAIVPSLLSEMPPLVDLVEEGEDDDGSDDCDDDEASDGSSSDDSCSESSDSDDDSDESSIDESELLDIIHPGDAFRMPPQRRAQNVAATPYESTAGTPKTPPKSVPLRVSAPYTPPSLAPQGPKPAPLAAAPTSTSASPAKAPTTKSHSPRIPMELQAVFLASQQGEVVDKPPESGAAFRVFGSWFGRRNRTDTKEKNSAGSRLLPSLLQRRQKPTQHHSDPAKEDPPHLSPAPTSRTKSGASRRISQFFKRKQPSSFRRMPQLPEISEVSCSMDTAVVEPSCHSPGAFGACDVSSRSRSSSASGMGSVFEGEGAHLASPVRRTFSVRSFGSSRRSSVGSAVSASSAASSAASANNSSSATSRNRLGKSVASSSIGSRSRQRPSDVSANNLSSRCSQSCASGTTYGSRPIASIASSDDNSTHSWDSNVSDLSSEDEALYADLEQMLSQAKADFRRKNANSGSMSVGLKASAPVSFPPTVPSFHPKSPVTARSPEGTQSTTQVNVYVPPTRTSGRPAAATRAEAKDPVTPVFSVSTKPSKGSNAFEPTIPSFPDKKSKNAPPAPSFGTQASRPAVPSAPSRLAQPSSAQSSRIPLELQEIFLRSNGGEDVEDIAPPSNGAGFKVFNPWRSGSVWAPLLRRNPSHRRGPLLVPTPSSRRVVDPSSKRRPSTADNKSVQSFTANTVDTSSPLSGPSSPPASPSKTPREIVYVPRIPEELQEIFVQSNRGHEVHHPPRSGSAFHVFERREGGRRASHQPFRLSSRALP